MVAKNLWQRVTFTIVIVVLLTIGSALFGCWQRPAKEGVPELGFPRRPPANTIILASDGEADLLVAVALSSQLSYPVIMSRYGVYEGSIFEEIRSRRPDHVIIVGQYTNVHKQYREDLRAAGIESTVLGGDTIQQTSLRAYNAMNAWGFSPLPLVCDGQRPVILSSNTSPIYVFDAPEEIMEFVSHNINRALVVLPIPLLESQPEWITLSASLKNVPKTSTAQFVRGVDSLVEDVRAQRPVVPNQVIASLLEEIVDWTFSPCDAEVLIDGPAQGFEGDTGIYTIQVDGHTAAVIGPHEQDVESKMELSPNLRFCRIVNQPFAPTDTGIVTYWERSYAGDVKFKAAIEVLFQAEGDHKLVAQAVFRCRGLDQWGELAGLVKPVVFPREFSVKVKEKVEVRNIQAIPKDGTGYATVKGEIKINGESDVQNLELILTPHTEYATAELIQKIKEPRGTLSPGTYDFEYEYRVLATLILGGTVYWTVEGKADIPQCGTRIYIRDSKDSNKIKALWFD